MAFDEWNFATGKYYARFKDSLDCIAIFESEEERDKWVDFKDKHSIAIGETADDCMFERVAMTTEEAEHISCNMIGLWQFFSPDLFVDNVRWMDVLHPRIVGFNHVEDWMAETIAEVNEEISLPDDYKLTNFIFKKFDRVTYEDSFIICQLIEPDSDEPICMLYDIHMNCRYSHYQLIPVECYDDIPKCVWEAAEEKLTKIALCLEGITNLTEAIQAAKSKT